TLKNAWTTSRQVNFFWVANFNLKFGVDGDIVEYGNHQELMDRKGKYYQMQKAAAFSSE
ncbi:hypothetical protein H7C83_10450, partial [Streptococcus pneumoniae]|nr:hypothetical protein [Streptococcus pneumoniae]